MSRRFLQVVNGGLGLLTLVLAGMTVALGTDSPVYGGAEIPALPALDSNLRFFGGMGFGLGAVLLWITPSIEKHGVLFRSSGSVPSSAGLGRIFSMPVVGPPPLPMIVFTAIEVPLVPILIYWQHRVARAA